eukprot:TRINITY_DN3990_c0_g1_i1.p1 TRINITY_DN3990_c0_g1~~TRINITY_DN3990_c0_g1_i1.p1  ORF type:complete len:280 (-),score=67.45 TRINITY_DN3990_c0_g1_i1:76-840(-)
MRGGGANNGAAELAHPAMQEAQPLARGIVKDQPPDVRAGFISKVYSLLSVQLLLTAAIAAPFVLSEPVRVYIATAGLPLVILASVLNLAFLCAMVCPCGCQENLRRFPTNYLLLGGFTVSEGFLVGVCCSFYSVGSVLLAVVCTAVLVGALTAYATHTQRDFTGFGVYLFAAAVVLLIFGIFVLFFPFPFLHKVFCCLGILLFSFYLIFDTQLLIGNGKLALGVDDYAFAALQLYMDIIQIFLYILQLTGDRDP